MPYISHRPMSTTKYQPMKGKLESTIQSKDNLIEITPFGGSSDWYQTRNPGVGNARMFLGGNSGFIGNPGPYSGV